MAFTRLSSELTAKTGIELDNVFILELMPFAPESYTKVYIYGARSPYSRSIDLRKALS